MGGHAGCEGGAGGEGWGIAMDSGVGGWGAGRAGGGGGWGHLSRRH